MTAVSTFLINISRRCKAAAANEVSEIKALGAVCQSATQSSGPFLESNVNQVSVGLQCFDLYNSHCKQNPFFVNSHRILVKLMARTDSVVGSCDSDTVLQNPTYVNTSLLQ